jgi:hypothetical protein
MVGSVELKKSFAERVRETHEFKLVVNRN